ncbi:tRNA (guanine-N(7)-)-methyltransferase [endosymbiont of Euscepes postfasciatus]|nr:tRNA (guanine-N(7)-)-methyltransferase [endosymbiont of Euscepes postfasciatus]
MIKDSINKKENNFLGIDNYLFGIGNFIKNINLYKINNIKIIKCDAKKIISKYIKNNSIYEIRIFFPDPWNKNKHKKRRLINKIFIKQLLKILEFNGTIHIITDSLNYFEYILDNFNYLLDKLNFFIKNIICYKNIFINTNFEKKSILKNNNIYYIYIQKNKF